MVCCASAGPLAPAKASCSNACKPLPMGGCQTTPDEAPIKNNVHRGRLTAGLGHRCPPMIINPSFTHPSRNNGGDWTVNVPRLRLHQAAGGACCVACCRLHKNVGLLLPAGGQAAGAQERLTAGAQEWLAAGVRVKGLGGCRLWGQGQLLATGGGA
jgi:hypothetical protein